MQVPTILIQVLNDKLDTVDRPCNFFVRDGQMFCNDIDAVDYYGEYRGGYPWIHPNLEQWAAEQGGYWEWENPEAIVFVPN